MIVHCRAGMGEGATSDKLAWLAIQTPIEDCFR